MKQYATYKPSGVEWLGDVPDHWEVKRLKFMCSIWAQYGLNESAESYQNEGVRFLRTSDIDDFGNLIGEGVCLPEEAIVGFELSDGDLLISRSGTIGRSFLYSKEKHGRCSFAGYLVRYSPTSELSPLFAFYFTKTVAYETFLKQVSIAATIGNVNGQKFANMTLPVPPLPEQRAIAAFLDERTAHLDGLIRRKEDLLKLLAEQRAALITRAVTRGLDAAAPLQASGVAWLGPVPAHWIVTRLKFVADVHSGIAKGKKYLPTQELVEVPYLRVANVQDGYLKLDDITTISVTPAEAKSYELQPQDILMNEGGDNDKLGRGTVWEGQVAPCIHQNHVFAIRHNGKVDSWFLSYFFGSTACKPYFFLSGNQATNLASISASAISDTPLGLPPLTEQREIVTAINQGNERLDKMTDITNREIEKLREYRAALITAAVTGRIDVRAAPEVV